MRSRAALVAVLLGGAVLTSGLVVAPAVPASACACGGVAPPPGTDVSVGEEHAIVSLQDGVERIDVLLGMLTSASETGLVFPTPSPATVELGDLADFDAVDRVTTPVTVRDEDWWTPPTVGAASAGAPPEVLDEVQLGPIRAVTLAASDAEGLSAWLTDNGFALSVPVTALLQDYVDRGWYFVALSLTGEAPLAGDLDPLRFTFDADELVYPLALSQAATSPQTVRVYAFGDHRQDVTFTSGTGQVPGYVTWAAPVTGTEVADRGDFLTVWELYAGDPATQITGDLAFSDAPTDEITGTEQHVTVSVNVFGVPAGWLLVGLGIVIAAPVAFAIAATRARRS